VEGGRGGGGRRQRRRENRDGWRRGGASARRASAAGHGRGREKGRPAQRRVGRGDVAITEIDARASIARSRRGVPPSGEAQDDHLGGRRAAAHAHRPAARRHPSRSRAVHRRPPAQPRRRHHHRPPPRPPPPARPRRLGSAQEAPPHFLPPRLPSPRGARGAGSRPQRSGADRAALTRLRAPLTLLEAGRRAVQPRRARRDRRPQREGGGKYHRRADAVRAWAAGGSTSPTLTARLARRIDVTSAGGRSSSPSPASERSLFGAGAAGSHSGRSLGFRSTRSTASPGPGMRAASERSDGSRVIRSTAESIAS
jgi:hypothetical protein